MKPTNPSTPPFNGSSANLSPWTRACDILRDQLSPQQFKAWLEPVQALSCRNGKLVLKAPTAFHLEWIQEHYLEALNKAVSDAYGRSLEVSLSLTPLPSDEFSDSSPSDFSPASATVPAVQESNPATISLSMENAPSVLETDSSEVRSDFGVLHENSEYEERSHPKSDGLPEAADGSQAFVVPRSPLVPSNPETPKGPDSPLRETPSPPASTPSSGIAATPGPQLPPGGPKPVIDALNARYTFESFVVGASNQFAHAACRAVAESPASQYNPLFLYSEAGLGKTHLLHAIGNAFLAARPKAKVCYISAESFVNQLIESIRTEKMSQFRQKYRDHYDMLLMDDFQFIAGKDRTQEEFFHTFNALHSSRKQIVVTSDKSPKDIPGLEDRIRTRFECGLIADIQAPEIETRIAILRTKAERDDVFLPDDVALYLASNIKSNIRELEGALVRLEAQASLNGVEITLELCRKELASMVKEPLVAVTPDSILAAVSRHFGLKIADLKSKDRSRKFSLPRQIAMYLLRKYTGKSLPEIGLLLGGKDHSTVLHGVNAVSSGLDKDPLVSRHVYDIQNSL